MAGLIARTGVACCLMHNRKEAVYDNFLQDMVKDMEDILRKIYDYKNKFDK